MQQNSYTILLVDDDIRSLNVLIDVMLRDGYVAIAATDGHDAILKAQNNPIDMVISDFHLPDMTGLEVLQQIKRMQLNVPIIMMSADSSPSLLLDVHEAGAYSFIRKPTNLTRLRQTVAKALSSRERRVTVVHETEAEGMSLRGTKQSRGVANAVKQTNHAVVSEQNNHELNEAISVERSEQTIRIKQSTLIRWSRKIIWWRETHIESNVEFSEEENENG